MAETSRSENLRGLESLRIARGVEQAPGRNPLLFVGLAAVLLAVAGISYEIYAHTLGKPLEVETAVVSIRGAGQSGVLLTGSGYVITRDKYIIIGTKILGQIIEEPIEEGRHVHKGDLLARIDDRDYVAQLEQAQADEQLAEANFKLATEQTRRTEKLYRQKVASRDEYDVAVNKEAVARAALERAKAAVDYAKFNVSQTRVVSPIDGVVLQKYREVGATINFGGDIQAGGGATDIAQLASTDDMRVEVDINESDIAKVHLKMPATIVLDAYPDRVFDATVVKIYPEANRQKGTVKVEVRFDNPDMHIVKPEMNSKVSFLAESSSAQQAPLVLVPKKAIAGEGAATSVWVVRDGAVHRTPIITGREFQGGVEVRRGLSGGEMVVISPPEGLKENQEISPKSA